jgi:ubiquinone/menaquinone biosynthesis C-methylase UbiE
LLGQAQALRRRTVDLAQLQAGETVLDVGCGTGDLTLAAQRRVGPTGEVCGVDPGSEMVEVARQKALHANRPIAFQVGVIEDLPFPDNTFDVVLSSLMMHHLPDDLKPTGLAEIRRVLKPAGRLLIVDFKRPTAWVAKVVLTLMLHGGLRTGVQDLPDRLAQAGFSAITTGNTNLRTLGYVGAQAGKTQSTR